MKVWEERLEKYVQKCTKMDFLRNLMEKVTHL